MSRRAPNTLAALAAAACLALGVSPALALAQPDGTIIPVHPGQNNLWGVFAAENEPIDPQASAADVPETFSPACTLTFTVVSRGGASFKNVFGWYNVTGAAPTVADLHVVIPCDAKPPAAFTIKVNTDPAYKGGQIGFFMITPEGKGDKCASTANIGRVYYSQKGFNPDNIGPMSYIHLLIYDSKVKANTFYFAWEDLFGGGDNEFTDLVTRVDGIACTGGGAPCKTGKLGVCGDGVMQCQNGQLICVPTNKPGPEVCDGLDNNCDGATDEGSLCPEAQVCDKGTCVPACNGGEFTCPPTEVCSAKGYCVDPQCAAVDCPSGQKCIAGQCAGPCDGVVCPHAEVCRVGICVDPCTNLSCDSGQVCVAGTCIDSCACAGCAATTSCQPDGKCIPATCVGKMCAAGTYCANDGTCADACAGAKCPTGETCSLGQCVPGTGTTGGAGGSASTQSGIFGTGGNGGSGSTAAGKTGAGGSGGAGASNTRGAATGCACRSSGPADAERPAVWALIAAATVGARRRRALRAWGAR